MVARLYRMQTERFGVLLVAAPSVAEARRYAKRVWGLGAGTVSPVRPYRYCEWCDSKPCCCDGEKPSGK